MKQVAYHTAFFIVALFLQTTMINAADYHGRATTGGFISKEKFTEPSAGSDTNDVAVMSNRFYLNVSNIGKKKWGLILDARDKLDYFDKLDKERLTLTQKNEFQLRQLAAKYPNYEGKFYASAGRFQAFDTGAVYVDGLEAGYRVKPTLKLGAFGGFNPAREGVSYLQFNSDSNIFGGFGIYENRSRKWSRYTYTSNAIIVIPASSSTTEEDTTTTATETTETEETATDDENIYVEGAAIQERTYFYNNSVIQWNRNLRFMSLLTYDIAPKSQLQSLWVSIFFRIIKRLNMTISAQRITAIEYARQQDLREELKPSQYDEIKVGLNYRVNRNVSAIFKASQGSRSTDELTRTDVSAGVRVSRLINRRFAASLFAGQRANFNSDDTYFRLGTGYYSNKFEVTLDQELGSEKYEDGTERNPKITELNTSVFFSKRFFGTIGAQYLSDEVVTITSALLRLSYRFGNREIAPIRDGAPPRGRI